MSKKQKTLFQTWSQNTKKKSLLSKLPVDSNKYHENGISCESNCNPTTFDDDDGDAISFAGFDMDAGKTWIYPTNFPIRDYQFSIVKECLFKNTMVILPTGLGKTFIAAVVMYNLYRWYPTGKVVFLAPTRPLVAQQRDACFQITGISPDDTVQMTGSNAPNDRKLHWMNKRVFFLTPQTLSNDLARNICPGTSIKCLVIDEAHRALGNHAYCEVVRQLKSCSSEFRVLALTATPGSDTSAVKQVISNLLISHIELRTDDSKDVQPYTHAKNIEKIIVPLGEQLSSLKNNFLDIINVYLKRLQMHKALSARNPASLSKFQIFKSRENFQKNLPQGVDRRSYGLIMADFALCISLYHAYELLLNHGIRPFYQFLNGILEGDKSIPHARAELKKNFDFEQMMLFIKEQFFSETEPQSTTTHFVTSFSQDVSNYTNNYVVGHPKSKKLRELVLNHFRDPEIDALTTRVIIFSQYRDSVKEIEDMLKHHHPVIKVMSFVGQASKSGTSKGITQKEQLKVVQEFRNGGYNTLVSTCVGEEGLDIGEVDLIICYDCPKSPIRLIQRIGRTGRKRKGKIIFLITEGKEEHTFKSSEYQKNSIFKSLKSGFSFAEFYEHSPRMVPSGIYPSCVKSEIKIVSKPASNVKSSLKNKRKPSVNLNDQEKSYFNQNFKTLDVLTLPPSKFTTLTESNHVSCNESLKYLSLTNWLPWQSSLQKTYMVSHSSKTKLFVSTLQSIDNPALITCPPSPTKKKHYTDSSKSKLPNCFQIAKLAKTSTQIKLTEMKEIKGNPKLSHDTKQQTLIDDIDNDSISIVYEKETDTNVLSFINSMVAFSESKINYNHKKLLNVKSELSVLDLSVLGTKEFYETSIEDLASKSAFSHTSKRRAYLQKLGTRVNTTSNTKSEQLNLFQATTTTAKTTHTATTEKTNDEISVHKQLINVLTRSPDKTIDSLKSTSCLPFEHTFTKPHTPEIFCNENKIRNSQSLQFDMPPKEIKTQNLLTSDEMDMDFIDSAPLFDENDDFEEPFIFKEPISEKSNSSNTEKFVPIENYSTSSKVDSLNIITKCNNPENNDHDFSKLNTTTQYSLTQLASFAKYTQKTSTQKKSEQVLNCTTQKNDSDSDDEICPTPPRSPLSLSMSFSYKNSNRSSQQSVSDRFHQINVCNPSENSFSHEFNFSLTPKENVTEVDDDIKKAILTNVDIKENSKETNLNDISADNADETPEIDLLGFSFDVDFSRESSPALKSSFIQNSTNQESNSTISHTFLPNKINEMKITSDETKNNGFKLQDFKQNTIPPLDSNNETKITDISDVKIQPLKKNVCVEDTISLLDTSSDDFRDICLSPPKTTFKLPNPVEIKQKGHINRNSRMKRNFDELSPTLQEETHGNESHSHQKTYFNSTNIPSKNTSKRQKTENCIKKQVTISSSDLSSNIDDDEDEDFILPKQIKIRKNNNELKPKLSRNIKINPSKDYIIQEAEVSDGNKSEDDTDGSSLDDLDESFIDDDSHNVQNTENLEIYLKSIKNYAGPQPQYKLKYHHDVIDVYSQPVDNTADYMLDSFCVDNDDITFISTSEDDSPARIKKKVITTKKRKRIVIESNSSSDDKTPNKSGKIDLSPGNFSEIRNSIKFPRLDVSPLNTCTNLKTVTNSPVTKPLLIDLTSSPEHLNNSFKSSTVTKNETVSAKLHKEKIEAPVIEDLSFDIAWDDPIDVPCDDFTVVDGTVNRIINNHNLSSPLKVPKVDSEFPFLKSLENKLSKTVSAPINSLTSEHKPDKLIISNASHDNTTSIKAAEKSELVLLASTRELACSKQVMSTLRKTYAAEVVVLSLPDTDYIVSNRMAVLRVQDTDFLSAPNIAKTMKKVKSAKDLYEKCCVIIEKDTRKVLFSFNKDLNPHLDFSLIVLQNSSVKILHSNSQIDSAKLLYDLADGERKRNMHINVPVHLKGKCQELYNFYTSLPHISPICAFNFVYHYPTVLQFLQSSVEELKNNGCINISRAHNIHWYIRANLQI